jgi:hypothetical protein
MVRQSGACSYHIRTMQGKAGTTDNIQVRYKALPYSIKLK